MLKTMRVTGRGPYRGHQLASVALSTAAFASRQRSGVPRRLESWRRTRPAGTSRPASRAYARLGRVEAGSTRPSFDYAVLISIRRGFAVSAFGRVRVSTPSF